MTLQRPVGGSLFPDLVPERPVGHIPGSVQRGTNADLIATIAPIYLTGSVLDVTYGNGDTAGGWWRRFTPDPFTYHDLALDGVDFRALPYDDDTFDAVCFDPPYVLTGGFQSSGAQDLHTRFGLGQVGYQAAALYNLILSGFVECARVAVQWVLVKCMEFAQGGKFHDVPHMVKTVAGLHGLVTHDQIVHHTGTGPGGGWNINTVKRCRRAHSYLLVFEVP